MASPEEVSAKRQALEAAAGKGEVVVLSVIDDHLLKAFSDRLSSLLQR
jgi:ethanolamine utilization protein EutP (predicted NTPase)